MSTLEKLRLSLGLRKGTVASVVGVSKMSICFWEDRRSNPRADFIPKYAEALGISPRELVDILDAEPRRSKSGADPVAA